MTTEEEDVDLGNVAVLDLNQEDTETNEITEEELLAGLQLNPGALQLLEDTASGQKDISSLGRDSGQVAQEESNED